MSKIWASDVVDLSKMDKSLSEDAFQAIKKTVRKDSTLGAATAKTHHKESAPGQLEITPYFEAASVAVVHQQRLMTAMTSTAQKHGLFACCTKRPVQESMA